MDLPSLPRKLNKREASITPRVMKWFENNYPKSCNVEVKVNGNLTKPHQDTALWQTAKGVFTHKIPDLGQKSPCDFYMIKKGDGVLVTCEKEKNRWICQGEVYGSNKKPFLFTP